jgi:hypothetical protein
LGHAFSAQRLAKMHCACTHPVTEHCVLRLSDLPFRRELGGAVGHRIDRAFSFSEVVSATSDTDMHGVMDVPSMCGHSNSIGGCSHCGCTEQHPEHCFSLFALQSGIIAGSPKQPRLRPIDAGDRNEVRAIQM